MYGKNGVGEDVCRVDEGLNCSGDGEEGGIIPHLLFPFTKLDYCEDDNDNVRGIYDNINDEKFLITKTISKTEVSLGRVKVRANPSHATGDWTDGYWKLENVAPIMMVMKMKISTKLMDSCQAITNGTVTVPSFGRLVENRPPYIEAK